MFLLFFQIVCHESCYAIFRSGFHQRSWRIPVLYNVSYTSFSYGFLVSMAVCISCLSWSLHDSSQGTIPSPSSYPLV
uniref:Uncharacterized protein n=1 Tax=Oryza brachyantha TaxID=4533 RepID=J3L9S2_ORYBR